MFGKREVLDLKDDFSNHLFVHDKLQDEVYELRDLAGEARSIGDLKALEQIKAALRPLKQDLEMVVNQIKVHLVGRLVRPKNIKNLLYEVQDFDADSFSLTLRRLLDQNGILYSQKNERHGSCYKDIRGNLL